MKTVSWLQSPEICTFKMLNLALERKKYVTANSINLENLTGKSLSLTDIYISMISISSQFLLLMENSWD